MSMRSRRQLRGFSILEMLMVCVILGLVLSMIGYEFVGVVSTALHTRANTDAQAQSRLIMTKVEHEMHAAFPDISDCPSFPDAKNCPSPLGTLVVVQPAPKGTPGPVAEFYRVRQGSLNVAIPKCPTTQRPCPPYDLVTIQLNALVPGELDETVQPATGAGPSSTTVIGNNVSSFTVAPDQLSGSSDYTIDLTVSIPSTHCTSNACDYTLNSVVYVGGLGTE